MNRILVSSLLWFAAQLANAGQGDEWTTVRGDNAPGYVYQTMTTTSTGRLIAISPFGALMMSDDGGTNWTYGQIEFNGVPAKGLFDTAMTTSGGTVYVIMREVIDAPGGFFSKVIRSSLVSSTNNGATWTKTVFPVDHISYAGHDFYGIDLWGLAEGPGGNLLAYGTVSGSNNGVLFWSLGGVIYQNFGGWQERFFGYGPIRKVRDAGGRAVAAAHNGILDSADGAGWNGYVMSNSNITLGGNPLDEDDLDRLRLFDIEYVNSTYVAQAGTVIKLAPNIDTFTVDKLFTINATTPFDGFRGWNAYAQSNFYGGYIKTGSTLLGVGLSGMFSSGNAGASFSQTNSTASVPWGCASGTSSSTFIAVENSRLAWKTTNTGASWSKVYDVDPGPDLFIIGTFGGRVFAYGSDNGYLWASDDNGDTWFLLSDTFSGNASPMVEGDGNRLICRASGGSIDYSDDAGKTWSNVAITDTISVTLFGHFAKSPSGRLFTTSEGEDIDDEGRVYVSDNNGITWTGKNAGVAFNADPGGLTVGTTGRIILGTNTFASFHPRIHYSDDDGETWMVSANLESTDGLDAVTGDPAQRTIDIKKLMTSPTGRILLLGEDEIVTSDDGGISWIVRKNYDFNFSGPNLLWRLTDIVHVGGRWVAKGSYTTSPGNKTKQFVLTSDDDGSTWSQKPLPTYYSTSFINTLGVGSDGRLLASGGNGTVMVSDTEPIMEPRTPMFYIRENTTKMIPVDRPGFSGAIDVSYQSLDASARENIDYTPLAGTLSWEDGDDDPKMIPVEALDNSLYNNGERIFNIQLAYQDTNDVVAQVDLVVSILDDEGGSAPGLVFEGAGELYTSESGDVAELLVVLDRQPSDNVVLTISGDDETEGTLSQTSFTFTPTNWNVQQSLLITGVDDNFPDGDHSYDLVFDISSNDTAYNNLSDEIVSVTNLGDEPYEVGGEFLGGGPATTAPKILIKKSAFAKGGRAKLKGSVTKDVVEVGVKAGKGGFKKAKLSGSKFTFKVRGLKPGKRATATILATNSDGRRAIARVKILPK